MESNDQESDSDYHYESNYKYEYPQDYTGYEL